MQLTKLIKLPVLIVGAVVVNLVMFGTIEYMVSMGKLRLTDTADIEISNFIRMQEQPREIRSRRDPTAPQKPASEMEQDIMRLSNSLGSDDLDTSLSLSVPEVSMDVDIGFGGDIQIARELTPLVRILAEYPQSALNRKIEGFVLLRFTVTETGSVKDPEVIQAEPENVFETVAKRAILQWKYQPQYQDDKPVSVTSYARLTFTLDQSLKEGD